MDNFGQTYQLLNLLFASDNIRLEDILFLSKHYIGDEYYLLNVYRKLKSLKSFDHLDAILEPYLDNGIEQPLTAAYEKILLYLDTVLLNDTTSMCNANNCNLNGKIKMQLHLKLAENDDKLMELFSLPSSNGDFLVEFGAPLMDHEKIDILSKIFRINQECVYVPQINFVKSKLLEPMVMNSIIKLGYAYSHIDSNLIVLTDQKQSSLDQFVGNFLLALNENKNDNDIRQSLQFINNFFADSSIDNQDYYKLLNFIYEWSVDINQLDNNIIDFLNSRLDVNVDLFPLLFESSTQNQCKNATVNGLLDFHRRLSTIEQENTNDQDFLEFVKTFKFKNHSIITYNDTRLELWPLEHAKLPPIEEKTKKKFTKLNTLFDYSYPFEVFEAIVICSDITGETESESLLKYVFDFDSYTCTLLSAAIYYYNVGLIEFDLRKMYDYVALLAKDKELNNNCSKLCVLPIAEKLHIKYIYQKFWDKRKKYMETFGNKRLIISQIIKSIRSSVQSFADLNVACSMYEIPEVYIIDFVFNTEMDAFRETILAMILLNSTISKYEKVYLRKLIEQNAASIEYIEISNVDRVLYFIKPFANQPTVHDQFISSNIMPIDYKIIVKHKNKIPNWRQLFLEISNNYV